MTLVQLRHFVGLVEHGSFVRAAEALYLTQPALSRSIQALEEELGGRLIDRSGRRVTATPLGREVLARARLLLSEAGALKQLARALEQGLTGSLRVGLSSAPGVLLSSPLMLFMAERHPRLHLQVARGSTEVLAEQLRAQRLDAAVVDIRSLVPSADLMVEHEFRLEADFLARPRHPLLGRGQPITIDDILAYPVASTPLSDEVARILISRYGPRANPADLVTLRGDETGSLVEVARASDAVVLTVLAVAPDLVRLPIEPPLAAEARFGLVRFARQHAAPALMLFEQWLAQWIAQHGEKA